MIERDGVKTAKYRPGRYKTKNGEMIQIGMIHFDDEEGDYSYYVKWLASGKPDQCTEDYLKHLQLQRV